MQLLTSDCAVLGGCEDDQELAGAELDRGKAPLTGHAGLVRGEPSVEIEPGAARVLYLEPVRALAVLVEKRVVVDGDELRDQELLRVDARQDRQGDRQSPQETAAPISQ